MVAGRRRFLWVAACWPWLATAAGLQLQLPAGGLEQGRATRLLVTAPLASTPLRRLDLGPLQPVFAIDRVEPLPPQGGRQRLLVWAYPRQPGSYSLPPLTLAGLATAARAVTVTAASDPTSGEPLAVTFESEAGPGWVRAPHLYRVEVTSPHQYLLLQPQPFQREGYLALGLPHTVEPMAVGGQVRYRHTTGWVVYPLRPGERVLTLPAVEYGREAVVSHRLYPPPRTLSPRPLPDYLPATVAVGGLELSGQAGSRWVQRDGVSEYTLELTAHGIPAQLWQPPLPQLQAAGVRFLPPRVDRREVVGPAGVEVVYRYTLGYVPTASGWPRVAPWRLHRFDPVSGRLQAVELVPRLPLVLAPWQRWSATALLVWVAVIAGWALWRGLGRWWRRLRGYRSLLQALARAAGPQDLRQALQRLAALEGWPANLALSEWGDRWRWRWPGVEVGGLLQALGAEAYGGRPGDPARQRAEWVRALERRLAWRRRLLWLCH